MIVWSQLALAIILPSREYETEETYSKCPLNILHSYFVSVNIFIKDFIIFIPVISPTIKTLTEPSAWPDTNCDPSGENFMELTFYLVFHYLSSSAVWIL